MKPIIAITIVVLLFGFYAMQFGAYHERAKKECNDRGGVYIMQQQDCQIPKTPQ